MGAQRHAIRRVVIEVHCRDQQLARPLQDEIAALFAARISPVIERCLEGAADPGHDDRLDRLELDLGHLQPARLTDEFGARIEGRLAASLRAAVRAARIAGAAGALPPGVPAVAVIAHFARTGRLPWPVDARTGAPVADAFDRALSAAPAALAGIVRGLARDPDALRRLIRALDDDRLEALTAAMAPRIAALPRPLLARLRQVPRYARLSADALRIGVWREAVRTAAVIGGAGGEDALASILTGIAGMVNESLATIVDDLRRAPPDAAGAAAATEAFDRAVTLIAGRLAASAAAPVAAAKVAAIDAELAALVARLAADAGTMAPLTAMLTARVPLLPAAERGAAAAAVDALRRMGGKGSAASQMASRLRALLMPFITHGLVTAADLRQPPRAAEVAAFGSAAEAIAASAATTFDDADAIYVENAGIVLLWPFLPRFFANLGLLGDDKAFASEAARHRAVGLLHHAATGDLIAPEYWLALNKALCGMGLDDVHEFGEPVTAAEAEETDRLLGAVLAHAPSFGTLTVSGLRGSFLLRRGALSERDGAFLLRVERQACDVVLDRLPWTREWMRLPWMRAPLRIEW